MLWHSCAYNGLQYIIFIGIDLVETEQRIADLYYMLYYRMELLLRQSAYGKPTLTKNLQASKNVPSAIVLSTQATTASRGLHARPASTSFILLASTNGSLPRTNLHALCAKPRFEAVQIMANPFFTKKSLCKAVQFLYFEVQICYM